MLRRSTGRSGTHFLSKLLATAPGVVAFHEASPTLSGHDTLVSAATDPEKSFGKRRHKADAILRSARWHLSQKGVDTLTYVDTSHLFLKAFSDVVMVRWTAHIDTYTLVFLGNAYVTAFPVDSRSGIHWLIVVGKAFLSFGEAVLSPGCSSHARTLLSAAPKNDIEPKTDFPAEQFSVSAMYPIRLVSSRFLFFLVPSCVLCIASTHSVNWRRTIGSTSWFFAATPPRS